MKHLDFLVWMILAPVVEAIVEALENKFGRRHEYSSDVKGLASLIMLLFYIFVGLILF